MKTKTNVKKAFKTFAKNCYNGNVYYYQLEVPSKKILVSNGHIVLTVSEADFEENKNIFKTLMVNEQLKKIALDFANSDTEPCKPTTVSILCGDKQTRVFKSDSSLGVVNADYLQVLEDVGCSMYFEVAKSLTGEIKTPIGEVTVANGDVYHCNMVLPINCNVKGVLEEVLGN